MFWQSTRGTSAVAKERREELEGRALVDEREY